MRKEEEKETDEILGVMVHWHPRSVQHLKKIMTDNPNQ